MSSSDEDEIACDVCKSAADAAHMLLCDACDTAFHMGCLKPKVTRVPSGDWFCPFCIEEHKSGEKPARWRMALKEGYDVKGQDMAGTWLDGKVVDVQGKKVLVHFLGWNSKFDEWYTKKSPKLAPAKWPGGAKKRAAEGAAPTSDPKNCPACRGRHTAHTCGRGKDSARGASSGKKAAGATKAAPPEKRARPAPAAQKAKARPPPKQAAKPKPAPKRKSEDSDEDDGEEHPTVKVVVGNSAKFLREEDGKKFYEWTLFARTEPVYASSSESDSESESDDEDEDAAKAAPAKAAAASGQAPEPAAAAADAAAAPAAAAASDAPVAAETKPGTEPSSDGVSSSSQPAAAAVPKAGGDDSQAQPMEVDKPQEGQPQEAQPSAADAAAAKKAAEKAERRKKREQEREAAKALAANFIRSAEFILHESYDPPQIKLTKPPFEVVREGWGIFQLPVTVETAGKRPLRVAHVLTISKPETKKTYTLDSVTGKLWRPKKKIVVEPRSRPERQRIAVKPKSLDEFISSPSKMKEEESAYRHRVAREADAKDAKDAVAAPRAVAQRKRKADKRQAEKPEDYAAWKRQVRPKSDKPVVSPQWLQHFAHVGADGSDGRQGGPAAAKGSPRRAVSSFTRPSKAPVKGFNDLNALYYVWPKMHKAVTLALERLPPKQPATSMRVARYFLIQYKRAQEPGEQSQAKSSKSNSKAGAAAAAAPSEKTAVGWQTRGLAVMDGAAHMPGGWTAHYPKELEAAADSAAPATEAAVQPLSKDDPAAAPAANEDEPAAAAAVGAGESAKLPAEAAQALDQTEQAGKSTGLARAVPLKLEDPEKTLVRASWTADEAEVVESAVRMYQQERLSELIANAHPDGGAQAMAPGPAGGDDGIGPVEKHLHDVQARRVVVGVAS